MRIMRAIGRALLIGFAILFKTCLFLIIPVFIVWANYTIDYDGQFKGDRYERNVAQTLILGENLTGYDQLNERAINELFIRNLEEPFDTIALGSSRVLQLRETDMMAGSFFNCGMSGADIRDILNTFYLFDKADKLPKNIIIGLDPWILNGNADAYNPRSDVDLYNEFLTLKLGLEVGYTAEDESIPWESLLSPVYLQQSLEYYFHTQHTERKPEVVEGDVYKQASNVKMADGSVLYAPVFRNSSLEDVEARARTEATTFMRMDGFAKPDPVLCDVFDRFIQYAQDRNVNVIFMLTPYHPAVYNYAQEHAAQYPGFFKTEPWFSSYARRQGIPLYGSYNPFVTGNFEEDFFDGLHLKEEGVSQFFPGVRRVLAAQSSGRAGSTWLYAPPRVDYGTALHLVVSRYEISHPHVMKQAADEWVANQYCYVLHRFESDAENATLLAKYAVSQDTGNIYRWDTDIYEWVWYTRFT